jgi:NADPH:quinone reductase-like Zn-dependent oxidoreductase
MRAIVAPRYGPPDVLRCEDVAEPTPADDEVLLAVRAASVNPIDRTYAVPALVRLVTGLRAPKDPRVGHDVAGEVVAVGRAVTRFAPGDAVFGVCRGAFAERACAKASTLVDMPPGVTFEAAAATPVAGLTALQGLRDHARMRPGAEVLVNGAAGGVGTFAVQIAKALGGRVTGVCGTRNVELVRSIGAERVIDYTREDFTRDPARWDVVLDCVGNHSPVALRRVLTPSGRCVLVGAPPRMGPMLTRLVAALALSPLSSRKLVAFVARMRVDDLGALRDLLASGAVRPVIGRRYALADAAAAFRELDSRHARGKLVVAISSASAAAAPPPLTREVRA